MKAASRLLAIRISPTIANEYATRCVFDGSPEWPTYIPNRAGVHALTIPEVKAVLDDAHFNGVDCDGPDCMPPGIKRAYRSLFQQCESALAEVSA